MTTGYPGYGIIGTYNTIKFGYKFLGRTRNPQSVAMGTMYDNRVATIEVMTDQLIFKQSTKLILADGRVCQIMSVDERLFSQVGRDYVVTLTIEG